MIMSKESCYEETVETDKVSSRQAADLRRAKHKIVKMPLRIFALLSFATTMSILSPIVSLAPSNE